MVNRNPARRLTLKLHPLVTHEFRNTMRDSRAYSTLVVYLSIVCGISLLMYIAVSSSGVKGVSDSSSVGIALFFIIIALQTVLVCFLTPVFTAGALNRERERDTYDLLRMSSISPATIVMAKLAVSVGYILMLLFAALPLISLTLLLGGVEILQIGAAVCVLITSALLISSIGLYISARMKTVLGSTIITYSVTTALVIGMAIFNLIAFPILNDLIYGTSSIAKTEPLLSAIIQFVTFVSMSLSPVSAMVASETNLQQSGNLWLISVAPLPGASTSIDMPSPFILLSVIYLGTSVFLLWRTVRVMTLRTD